MYNTLPVPSLKSLKCVHIYLYKSYHYILFLNLSFKDSEQVKVVEYSKPVYTWVICLFTYKDGLFLSRQII